MRTMLYFLAEVGSMVFFMYFLNILSSMGQTTVCKAYTSKGGDARAFNISKASAGILAFLALGLLNGLSFHINTVLYGIVNGLMLAFSMYTGLMALSMGPMALTSIIASFSLIIPFVFGITVFNETLTVYGLVGIILLLASIVLLNIKHESGVSVKWSVFAILTLIANGVCALIQKYHQTYYPKMYKTEFMLTTMIVAAVVMLLSKGKGSGEERKPAFSIWGAISGALGCITDYTVLYLVPLENASILFPAISVMKAISIWIVGKLFFREALRKIQIVGLILGIAAVLLLNL